MKKQGFTLIELLVVIAIISLLASIVTASLNSARAKATDAAIIADLNGIRTAAEIEYDDNDGYYGEETIEDCYYSMFDNVPSIRKAIEQIASKMENEEDLKCYINYTGNQWSIETKLLSSEETFCIDYTGFAGEGYYAENPDLVDMDSDGETYCTR